MANAPTDSPVSAESEARETAAIDAHSAVSEGESGPAIVAAERAAFASVAAELAAGRKVLVAGKLDAGAFAQAAGRRFVEIEAISGLSEGPFDVVVADIDGPGDDAETLVSELPRLTAEGGVAVVRLPNRPDCRELRDAVTGAFAAHGVLRQHNWIASAILDDAQFASEDPAVPLVPITRKLAGAAPGAELYTIVIASDVELPQPAFQIALTRSLEARRLLEREAAAYVRAREAEAEADLARAAQLDRIRELEERLAWLQEWQLDVQDKVESRPWAMNLLKSWVIFIKVAQKLKQLVRR